ncbi:MAG: hypothetical protein NTW21_28350 [Verrucomicrobia bacterium]|nr:hypothetical protein [Verrucomicrobiota bacterium]
MRPRTSPLTPSAKPARLTPSRDPSLPPSPASNRANRHPAQIRSSAAATKVFRLVHLSYGAENIEKQGLTPNTGRLANPA